MKNYVNTVLLCIAGCWLLESNAHAQDFTTINFFPYQTGDFWVYEDYWDFKQEVINEVKYRVYADSTDSAGTRWVHIETDDNSSKDSVYYKVHKNGDVYFDEYYEVELKALKYEETNHFDGKWVAGAIREDEYAVFNLLNIDEIPFFGEMRERRIISVTVTSDTTCRHCGMDIVEDTWVEDFGVVGRGGYEGGSRLRLKGAWKGGEVFGDTTFSEITVDTLRGNFFPYETGDFWVYGITKDWGNPPTEQQIKYRVYADSTDVENTKWVYVEKNVKGVIDSVYYKVMASGDIYSDDLVGTEMLKFKFKDTSEGDFWVGGTLDDGHYGVYNLRNIGWTDIFYTPQKVFESRGINYYAVQDTSNWSTTEKVREHWTASFGITSITYYDNPDAVAWGAQGIYKDGQVYGDTTFSVITSNEPTSPLPKSFKLYQNYPNPFNPSTTVEYEISKPVKGLSATLYTYTGQKVAKLFNEKYHSPGTYHLTIDKQILGSAASSMLILTFKSNTETQHLKMIYLK